MMDLPPNQVRDERRPGHGGPAVEAYFLGKVDFDACRELQQRLVFEASGRNDGQITVLFCEHDPLVTIGRGGSRSHLDMDDDELRGAKLEVRWINRGGGCWLHVPGQLAIYPVAPLFALGWSVGEYLQRLNQGLLWACHEVGVVGQRRTGRFDVWGRSGLLAGVGVAVKQWTSYHGAFVNVAPATDWLRRVSNDPDRAPTSSLTLERQQPVRMARFREAALLGLTRAFGGRHHLYTHHPWLRRTPTPTWTY